MARSLDELDNSITAIGNQWEIQFARFVNYPVLSSTCFHLQRPRSYAKHHLKGNWICTSSSTTPSLQLLTDPSTSDVILTVCLQGRIIEEHFVSKLNFTWPHVSCVSGFPTRGSRVVFASYKDNTGEIQKFALRFLTINDTEAFIVSVKPSEDVNAMDLAPPSYNTASEFSCQSEFVQELRSPYRPSEESNIETSIEASTKLSDFCYEVQKLTNSQQTPYTCDDEGRPSYSQELLVSQKYEGNVNSLPPSFMSLITNCVSEGKKEQPQLAGSNEVDFKSQVVKYMEDSSFLDLFVKVEKVVNELEQDLMLPSSVDLH